MRKFLEALLGGLKEVKAAAPRHVWACRRCGADADMHLNHVGAYPYQASGDHSASCEGTFVHLWASDCVKRGQDLKHEDVCFRVVT